MNCKDFGNRNLEGVANIFIVKNKPRAYICKLQLWIGNSAFASLETPNGYFPESNRI